MAELKVGDAVSLKNGGTMPEVGEVAFVYDDGNVAVDWPGTVSWQVLPASSLNYVRPWLFAKSPSNS